MISRKFIIRNVLGMHGRATERFIRLLEPYNAEIVVERHGLKVNGRDIMDVMMLSFEYGDEILVYADGVDENEAMAAIEELIGTGFEEGAFRSWEDAQSERRRLGLS